MRNFLTNQAVLFSKNRAKFSSKMASKSIAVFNSNDIYPTSADGTIPFVQHSDIYYLTGVDQEETILLLFPDAFMPEHREILFVRKTNEHIAIWEGEKLTKAKATEVTGITTILWTEDFDKTFKDLMAQVDNLYLNTNEHLRNSSETQTREDRFISKAKALFPAHQLRKSAPILHQIRSVKEQAEIELMQIACDITEKGFKRVLQFTQPGVNESEIEAEFIHEFIRNKSKGFAYEPIIAAGQNNNCLHYTYNNQICQNGDLILMDVGAEYQGYKADMTRTIPVNGKFTKRQKEVYQSVLQVKNEADKILRPGVYLHQYHKEVGLLMQEQLLKLGLLTQAEIKTEDPNLPAYKKYFMHGTSHFIGVDVHDVGLWTEPIEENMVFTIEPGIYIPEEGFGIRIEDDVVIGSKENFNLMRNIPVEVEEIEDWMNK